MSFSILVFGCGLILAAAAGSYLLLAIVRVAAFRPADVPPRRPPQAVTILKPVCGAEPRLYECLRSFCRLDHAPLQIVFGVGDRADPAVAVVKRLIREFPALDLSLVIDSAVHGTNLKVSNLINMHCSAKHDIVVVSDSDTEVARDCLDAVLAPFADPAVGAVTCLYKGAPAPGLASSLGALFVNDWFLASAVVDAGMREAAYCLCFGPVTALRRSALEAMGGFGMLAFHLADDFMLGRMIAAAGYKVRLASYVPDIVVVEDFASLLRHELRWARTVRTVRPGEHFLSAVMQPLPLLLLLLLPFPQLGGWFVLGALIALRIILHFLVRRRFAIATPARPWLLPLRECLCFAIWLASYRSSHVSWRERDFVIAPGGRLEPRALPAAVASGGS
ncbi:MAG TPA: bacteriohopanetetrol glucosamine biosynthesis glycosyltransferase HpnI [Stellaceae bacterium]|nr:bacteriohopanetetrol glucosamine biosynthesis glycosyltransferase HpnI [Stellaceae bacterium]